jgi:hypothetical protein
VRFIFPGELIFRLLCEIALSAKWFFQTERDCSSVPTVHAHAEENAVILSFGLCAPALLEQFR